MERCRLELLLFPLFMMVTAFIGNVTGQDDFSGPIKCYYCLGDAQNSSCSDPIYPRTEKSRNLKEIECDRGICLKWTYYYNNQLFMHRTCSEKHDFRIMMIDGVCRSERNGNGYLCMCGKHLCNTGSRNKLHNVSLLLTTALLLTTLYNQRIMSYVGGW